MSLARLLEDSYRAALRAVDPAAAVAAALPAALAGRSPSRSGRTVVLAVGKAAPAMVAGARAVLSGAITGIQVGAVAAEPPSGMRHFTGGHPLPTARSLAAGEALLEAARSAGPDDLVVVLLSGGASALAEAPIVGVTLSDVRLTTDLLLRSGADIGRINTVRTHLSRIKGGGLAAALASPLGVMAPITLAVSDVVGDRPEVIGSGPVTEPSTTADDAVSVLVETGIVDHIPQRVLSALTAPPPARTGLGEVEIVLSRSDAAQAACDHARRQGRDAVVVDTDLTGEASLVAVDVVTRSFGATIGVFAGETTVTVTGSGHGGRNHEAALAAALALEGDPATVFLAAGTDGVDGTAGGAGAVVDGTTARNARAVGIDPDRYLAGHDSGGFFDAVPGRIASGPTGTNVGDLWLVGRRSADPEPVKRRDG